MVTVLAAAPVTALIELATVKSRLGITGTSQDVDLTDFIAAISSAVAATLGDTPIRQTYAETVASDRTRFQLSRWPIDPDQVTLTVGGAAATDFTVEDADHGWLYRAGGWSGTWTGPGEDLERNVVVTYRGGYLLPASATARGVLTTWAASTAYAAGAWVRPSSPALTPLHMECTTAGTSGSAEPAWPSAGATVTDGTAVWTARRARELPAIVRDIAWIGVQARYDALSRPAGLASREVDGLTESYFATHLAEYLPPAARAALQFWAVNR